MIRRFVLDVASESLVHVIRLLVLAVSFLTAGVAVANATSGHEENRAAGTLLASFEYDPVQLSYDDLITFDRCIGSIDPARFCAYDGASNLAQPRTRLIVPTLAAKGADEGRGLLAGVKRALADERGSIGYGDLPRRARTFSDFDAAAAHLQRFHGINPRVASQRLHEIKGRFGYRGADNVLIDRTGNVYDPGHASGSVR